MLMAMASLEIGAESLLRALAVLETLASMEQPAGLDAIIARTKLSRMKTYRALRSLQQGGYVDHVGRSGYRVGSRSLALASLIGPRPALEQRARPFLARLAQLTTAGAALHLRSGASRVLVMGVQSKAHDPFPIQVGERAPLTSGSTGRVILAHLPDGEAKRLITDRPAGEDVPTPATLDQIRRDGFALSFGTNWRGFHAVAAPLLDPVDGSPLGAITIAGAAERMPETELLRLSGPLVSACSKLSSHVAKLLGPHSTIRYSALDVTIRDFLAR
jgi:DNA-binding IclR family transcriptional regulator